MKEKTEAFLKTGLILAITGNENLNLVINKEFWKTCRFMLFMKCITIRWRSE